MSGMKPCWVGVRFDKTENSLSIKSCFARHRGSIGHRLPEKRSFLGSISDIIGVRFRSCSHILDLVCFGRIRITLHMSGWNVIRRRSSFVMAFHSLQPYNTDGQMTVLYKWDIVRGLTLLMLLSEGAVKRFPSFITGSSNSVPEFWFVV